MARKLSNAGDRPRTSQMETTAAEIEPTSSSIDSSPPTPDRQSRRRTLWIGLGVVSLLGLHLALAERSLLQENPTVDEVVHMPAGLTYWDKGTFKLYHHNPPLVKMAAALPVWLANPILAPLYDSPSKAWSGPDPSQATFSQEFAFANADRFFEFFDLARMVMPLFTVLGGLVVFAWSSRLYGAWGGLLSLALWCLCPNILAHGRLVTSDAGSTALGVGATYLFWRYLQRPSWARAGIAGAALGVAQLSKFSMLLLYLVWPFLWVVRLSLTSTVEGWAKRIGLGLGHAVLVVALSVLVIDAGYFFEGVGRPLGSFEFASSTLTSPPPGDMRTPPETRNQLYAMIWPFAQNRFRGTILEHLPAPLPEHYLLGFDEQKIEADGIPNRFIRGWRALQARNPQAALEAVRSSDRSVSGYPVYLNGEMRNSGWWYYYLATLAYKVPEGTWLILAASVVLLATVRRSREGWADEIALWTIPVAILFAMSFLTDINLGLRYVLAILPYLYIQAGKLAPWIESLSSRRRTCGLVVVSAGLSLTAIATFSIHPHYLAYFNQVSGGSDRSPARLIDSNLDWGQDLVGLREWCRTNTPDAPIGLAYFGQFNPSIFTLRGDTFDWFLPPVKKGTIAKVNESSPVPLVGPAPTLTPGYYAVSATLVYGLHWRVYDSSPRLQEAWGPTWRTETDSFGYFRLFQPVDRIGHSIYIYQLTEADVARAAPLIKP